MNQHYYIFLSLLILNASSISATEQVINQFSLDKHLQKKLRSILPAEPIASLDNKRHYCIENSCFYTYYKENEIENIKSLTAKETKKYNAKRNMKIFTNKKTNKKGVKKQEETDVTCISHNTQCNTNNVINNSKNDLVLQIKEHIIKHEFGIAKRKIGKIKNVQLNKEMQNLWKNEHDCSIEGQFEAKFAILNNFTSLACQEKVNLIFSIFTTQLISEYDRKKADEYNHRMKLYIEISPLFIIEKCDNVTKHADLKEILQKFIPCSNCYKAAYCYFADRMAIKVKSEILSQKKELIEGKKRLIELRKDVIKTHEESEYPLIQELVEEEKRNLTEDINSLNQLYQDSQDHL